VKDKFIIFETYEEKLEKLKQHLEEPKPPRLWYINEEGKVVKQREQGNDNHTRRSRQSTRQRE
jgi:sugar-specific transcriptional regulator TrmB